MFTPEQLKEAGLDLFRNYLRDLWKHLQLPPPTHTQLEIADYMQFGPKRQMVQAFRGVGKSYMAAGLVSWGWLWNPQLRNVTVSATQDFANELAQFVHQIVATFPLIQYLQPTPKQRQSVLAYDVALANPDKSPSLKSLGIMSQLAGSRADRIIVDDVEVPKNSFTHELRQKLSNQIRELGGALLKPTDDARVLYLGTPQTEQTIYKDLVNRGYDIRIWPSEIPKKPSIYMGRLAHSIQERIAKGVKAGTPVDPQRFNVDQLKDRLAEYQNAGYALQFLLDTSPADAEKHPLKLSDLMVTDLDVDVANVRYVWGREANNRSTAISELPVASLEGDTVCYRPAWASDDRTAYTGRVMFVDPSGQGKDETSYAIVFQLFGQLFLMKVGGFKDGFSPDTLNAIAVQAKAHKVQKIIVEPNYGGGMFTQLLKPVVQKDYLCSIEDAEWAKGQKELRIIDTLHPVMQQHRLIVNKAVLEEDYKTAQNDPQYSFFYQLTRITKDRGSLPHEDRLESVAGAVQYWVASMARDTEKSEKEHKSNLIVQSVKGFVDAIKNGTGINLGYNSKQSAGRWRSR
jgi:hypothetical protein